ncbi:class I poly(R)-hydroxyalkanoic acid synthase [Kiloniella laminariae]|uniref:Class I poly(R)-hydroxyalkanoic acid synthase n=1 Tax=Kiloniella laminariae TaxID=454162 RepID=A0ABT4LG59_9PROT|nr:class I poly(R)-hydroxyalkanoic acid synthase [Kiloniella laminariae]MCZ4280087.1 class I poly(R)-hydroxyalkanoic acid synthase [Kiloniella laminariae]
MADQHPPKINLPDPAELAETMSAISEKSQELIKNFMARQQPLNPQEHDPDPLRIGQAFLEMSQKFWSDPDKAMKLQSDLWQGYTNLWQQTANNFLAAGKTESDENKKSPAPKPKGDRRFQDEAWENNPFFNFIKQSYLLTSETIHKSVTSVDGLDKQDALKVDFYTRQFLDAVSPSNFLMTNPEILRVTTESGGKNLLQGLENLISDLEKGRVKMTDEDAFTLGENVATTPGSVIYQNELMQLIQYSPTTEQVHERPLLILPPWINKFYILDLKAKNSFVKWAVEQGFTVFMVSWINPDARLAEKSFEDYMLLGPLAALDAIEQATGAKEVNAIGYCLGGTLLASTLAYMAEKKDKRIKSGTFFVTMTDFSEAGELRVFIDEDQMVSLEKRMADKGYLDGAEMGTTFNMLRANDLIWSFVVNNYLLGKTPFPFDLLYWNSDTTRMPKSMHSFYLRKMYLENKLAQPGGIVLDGVPIDLGKITVPSFIISAKEDHIAPWKSTYANTKHFSGKKEFVLSASGHIAGIINPPDAGKYSYWTNRDTPADPDEWLDKATEAPGSWWPHWAEWEKKNSGKLVDAKKPGSGKLKIIEPAPGSYVRIR